MPGNEKKLNELMLCSKILAVFILFRKQIMDEQYNKSYGGNC